MTAWTEASVIEMKPCHVEDVARLEEECFSSPWTAKALEESAFRDDTLFLVAEKSGTVAGYVGAYLSPDSADITNVAVSKDFRRQGIARLLMAELIRLAKEKGLPSIILEVRVSNAPAIALYEGLGFKNAGTRRGFYTLPREDAYIMTLEI